MPIEVPDIVKRTALDHAHGAAWLAGIDDLVGGLAADWGLTIGEVFGGGTASVCLAVTTADGAPAVLKVAPDDLATEARTFALADGRGCARLLAHDLERRALLLERLGASLDSLGLPTDDQLRAIAATVQQLWVPVPDGDDVLTLGDAKGRWLAAQISEMWEDLDHPCTARAVERAVSYAERRTAAFDRERAVLVHGDAHQWNTLEAGDGFKLVDPDGLCADREYDLAIPIREVIGTPEQGRLWCHLLAGLTGTDATAIWEWGFVERVSTGLLCAKHEMQPEAARMLAIADAWAL